MGEFIGVVEFVGFVGVVGVFGFVEFIGFVGFVGFFSLLVDVDGFVKSREFCLYVIPAEAGIQGFIG